MELGNINTLSNLVFMTNVRKLISDPADHHELNCILDTTRLLLGWTAFCATLLSYSKYGGHSRKKSNVFKIIIQ